MELKTVATPHVPVRYLEGGQGPALVYLHGAGGVTAADPLLNELAKTHHVYAPLLPGYGDSQECPELRDMLDITLHYWDVVEALGLTVVPFDAQTAVRAGLLRERTRTAGLSLGDRACLALAATLSLPVLTADRNWDRVSADVEVHQIR